MSRVGLYAALGLGWAGFAGLVVPPLLLAERPGPLIGAVKRALSAPPVEFLQQDPLGRWIEFSVAVLIAIVLHGAIVATLDRHDRRAPAWGAPRESRAAASVSLALAIAAAAFLAATILSGVRQDYFFYLQMWFHVRRGDDPWYVVPGINGMAPLNAYGPLFNLLAPLAWINPMAPKLLFAGAYLLFAISRIKGFAAGRPPSALRAIGLSAVFWGPFAWFEVAFYGHFDILVGLACLAAVRARRRDRDVRSGMWLALGVLLKYLPIVLLPFLALDRARPRARLLAAALTTIALGLLLSCSIWGLAALSPLKLAATRRSAAMSIFYFLRGAYSPLSWFGIGPDFDYLEPPSQLLALLLAWWWSRARRPGVEASAAVAAAILVMLYRVGYPQYQMVPFVLGSAWALGDWDRLRGRAALAFATAGYLGWVTFFDVYYTLVDSWHVHLDWYRFQALAGLPTLVLGGAFLAAAIRAATPPAPPEDPIR